MADRFILGLAPFDYDPVVLLKPSGPRLAAGALSSRKFCNDGSRSAYLSPGFRRRASLASPYLSLFLADEALPPSLNINPGPRVEWDFNPPETPAARHTLRASPPPQRARTLPHGRPVDPPLITPSGFPCCGRFPCVHAVATTPAQRLGSLLLTHPAVSAFPDMAVRSACATSFSRLARRSLALRPTHSRCHHIS